MNFWYVLYLFSCVANTFVLTEVLGLGYGDLSWWVSNLCVIVAFIAGRRYEEDR